MMLAVVLCLGVMWFAVGVLDASSSFRFYWEMLGAGLVVAIGGVVLFGIAAFCGEDWERRQVQRYLARRKGRESDTNPGP